MITNNIKSGKWIVKFQKVEEKEEKNRQRVVSTKREITKIIT